MKVLKDDPINEKALFRKGVALMRADNWDKAIEQLEKCKDSKEILKKKFFFWINPKSISTTKRF